MFDAEIAKNSPAQKLIMPISLASVTLRRLLKTLFFCNHCKEGLKALDG